MRAPASSLRPLLMLVAIIYMLLSGVEPSSRVEGGPLGGNGRGERSCIVPTGRVSQQSASCTALAQVKRLASVENARFPPPMNA